MLKSIKIDYSVVVGSSSSSSLASSSKRHLNELEKNENNLILNKKQKFSIDELLNVSEKNLKKSFFSENSLSSIKLQCRLEAENQNLWKMFSKIGTEMIITKPGRWEVFFV